MKTNLQVSTQAELDAALKDGFLPVCIGNGKFSASGSAQVTASDSAQVTASGSAQVTASGSAQVTASGSAQVTASGFVAVTTHGKAVKVVGGKVIKIVTPKTAVQWLSFYGVPIKKGVTVLFKAVSKDFKANHNGFDYTPGTTPKAPDWDGGKAECGGGLHFSPRPFMALKFHDTATKFVACPVKVSEIVVHPNPQYPDKIKAPGCCAPVWECDIDGNKI